MLEASGLAEAVCNLQEREVRSLIAKMLEDNIPAVDILAQCHAGMGELGKRFQNGECYIPELIMAGQIMELAITDLGPALSAATEQRQNAGTVVIGTVKNDIHDLGKDIVVMMLRGSGFNVVDLGVNVAPEKFVRAIQEHNPIAVGMSVLLTTCYTSITETIGAIQHAGLRDKISLMVGGAAATKILAEKAGCDFYGATAVDAVTHAASIAQSQC